MESGSKATGGRDPVTAAGGGGGIVLMLGVTEDGKIFSGGSGTEPIADGSTLLMTLRGPSLKQQTKCNIYCLRSIATDKIFLLISTFAVFSSNSHNLNVLSSTMKHK